MAAVGGSIESISVRGRIFPVAADAEANIKMGGFENEVQPNGNGTARIVKARVPWKVDGVQVEIDNTKGDAEFLQEIADGQEFEDFTITLAGGAIFEGAGIIVDEVQTSTQSTTATISLEGPGALTQQ